MHWQCWGANFILISTIPRADSVEPSSAKKRQRLIEQAKEVGVFALLFAVRYFMTQFAGALASPSNAPLHGFKAMLESLAMANRLPMLVIGTAIFAYAIVSLACGRLLPGKFLDILGIFVVINLVIHFLKINLLLFTPPGPANLLLGQLLTFVVFFVVAWGWLYWRLDCATREGTAGIFALTDQWGKARSGETLGMFDYMYSSMYLIQTMGRISTIAGSTRFGLILVSIHSFMVIDLVTIGLGRFYQLIQKTI
jgi:hypothetical protein